MSQWIDVTEQLPPEVYPVVAYLMDSDGNEALAIIFRFSIGDGKWRWVHADGKHYIHESYQVTHWMPYPNRQNGAKHEREIRITERGLHRVRRQNALSHSGAGILEALSKATWAAT